MSYQSDLVTALLADATVSGIVGTKIFGDVADEDPAPYLVYSVPSSTGETRHDGLRGLEFPTIQISCWATSKPAAIALAAAVMAVCDGQTISGSANLSLVFSNQVGQYDPETKLYGEIIDFTGATNPNT